MHYGWLSLKSYNRYEMTSTVEQLIGDLATKPGMIEKGEELKTTLLATPAVTGQIDALWVSIENRLEAPLTVGRDLQSIRIDGTIVDGPVGLIIFAVTQLF